MKQAISYVRFSSFRQRGGSTVERQTDMIAEWLADHPEYTLSGLKFQDLAKSGYKGEHVKEGGGFGKLLAAVKAGAIGAGDVVLVEAIDRTGRLDTVGMLDLLTPILKAGVSIITLDDKTEYTRESVNGSHIYLLMAKIQAANQYSAGVSRRIKSSYRKREDRAKAGEQIKRMTPVWLTTDGVVVERIATHIKTVFELYCAGVGKSTIAVRMRETGEPELAKCSGPTVEGWLRNKTVLGYWNDIPDAYPAIIDPVLFLRAQQRSVEARTTRPAKTAKHFLVGLVKCGHCGGNYIMQNKDGSPHSMRCLNRQRLKDSGCSNTRTIPKAVLDYIRSTTSTPAIRAAMKRQQLTANESRILAIQNELEGLSKQIQRLATILATMDDVPEIQAQLVERHAQRKMLEQEKLLLERSEPEDPARMLWKDAVAQLKEEAPEREALEADKIKLNALLRSVGYKIVVHDDGGIMVGGSGYKYIGYHREGSTFKLIHQGVTRYINKGGVEVQQAMLVPVGAVDVKVGDIPRITDVAKYIKPITIKRG